jgi:hypothetical protein
MTDDGDEDRPRRQPLDIADQIIAPQLEPLVRKAGHAYDGALVVEKWARTKDGNWLVFMKLGHGSDKFGDRYIHLIGPTLYHLRLGDYFHSRASAERAYAEAAREPYREPTPSHERFASEEARERSEHEFTAIVAEGRRRREAADRAGEAQAEAPL